MHTRVGLAVVVAAGIALGSFADAADRAVVWLRPGPGALERELNEQARRGLRLAAVADGLPTCAVVVMQAPEPPAPPAQYRVVADRDVSGALAGLVEEGFVPKASARGLGLRHEVIFERASGAVSAGEWRAVEFESLDALEAAVSAVTAEGYRAGLLARPAFRSWPGLSERGIVLAHRPARAGADAGARETRVVVATRRNVDDVAKDVARASTDGWELDLVFAQARDGGTNGRRERGVFVLSRGRAGAAGAAGTTSVPAITVERRSAIGILGDRVLGVAAYWDEVLVASADDDRRQTWSSPVRLGESAMQCTPLPLSFRFDAPGDVAWSIVGLLAVPTATGKGMDLVVLTDQRLGVR